MFGEDFILVIGAGNDFRSDDAVGPVAAKKIFQIFPEQVKLIKSISDSTHLIEEWKKYKYVYFIDAIRSGARPGTVFRYDALEEEIPEEIVSDISTHSFNLKDTIELGRKLGRLPENLIIFGIEGKNFEYGTEFSDEIKPAIGSIIIKIKREIDELAYVS